MELDILAQYISRLRQRLSELSVNRSKGIRLKEIIQEINFDPASTNYNSHSGELRFNICQHFFRVTLTEDELSLRTNEGHETPLKSFSGTRVRRYYQNCQESIKKYSEREREDLPF